jgi:hypothetical protein
MPITLPKTEALAQLKSTLKDIARDGMLDDLGGETRTLMDAADTVMKTLKTKGQLDLLVDKIEEAINPLKYNTMGGFSGLADSREMFLSFLRSDAKDRLNAVKSDGIIDHNFP